MNSGDATGSPPKSCAEPQAAYLHVPFCVHRCGYCDFTLIAGRDDLIGDFLSALKLELASVERPEPILLETLFFGGGTPTYLPPDELRQLFQHVWQRFKINEATEVSVEANPIDLSSPRINQLAELGVNRISLGVQSFSAASLALLERDHTPEMIVDVVHRLRPQFRNVSLDLIFGVPGQSLMDWRDTLNRAIDLGPQHLSTYGLTFEKGTAFWTRRARGELSAIDEELEREQYLLAMDVLSKAGYVQYEISNFAQPGYECRHNHVYWNGDEYFAFGPGAARYLNGRRETNIRSVHGWLNRLEHGESPVADYEELDTEHRARELIYLGLRRNRGIDKGGFQTRTGCTLEAICADALRQQIQLGLIEDDGTSIRLTREGRLIADRVVMEFL